MPTDFLATPPIPYPLACFPSNCCYPEAVLKGATVHIRHLQNPHSAEERAIGLTRATRLVRRDDLVESLQCTRLEHRAVLCLRETPSELPPPMLPEEVIWRCWYKHLRIRNTPDLSCPMTAPISDQSQRNPSLRTSGWSFPRYVNPFHSRHDIKIRIAPRTAQRRGCRVTLRARISQLLPEVIQKNAR
jgi:hypothetical protein